MSEHEYDRIMRAMLENVDGSTISDDLKDGVANLALAAPDLLAACKELFLRVTMHYANHQEVCKLGDECPDKKALKIAEAAIAKAEVKP